MKQRHYIGLIALLATAFTSCVHDFPDDGGVDPTLVEVSTEVTLAPGFIPLEITPAEVKSRTADGWRRRFVVSALREGKEVARQITVTDEITGQDGKLLLPASLKLHALEYTLTVWADYVKDETGTDVYYDTRDLSSVVCIAPYTGGTDRRDCLYGTATIDLRRYRDEWNAHEQASISLVRPQTKYSIVATDVQKFLAKIGQKADADLASYTITFSYGFYIPLGFDVLTGRPAHSKTGVMFTLPLTLPADGQEECCIGSDFVFVNGQESSVLLGIEIKDGTGKTVSRTTGLEVPYRRGHITTVRGPFLTNEMQGGITIDPGFDGEIYVDIDTLY